MRRFKVVLSFLLCFVLVFSSGFSAFASDAVPLGDYFAQGVSSTYNVTYTFNNFGNSSSVVNHSRNFLTTASANTTGTIKLTNMGGGSSGGGYYGEFGLNCVLPASAFLSAVNTALSSASYEYGGTFTVGDVYQWGIAPSGAYVPKSGMNSLRTYPNGSSYNGPASEDVNALWLKSGFYPTSFSINAPGISSTFESSDYAYALFNNSWLNTLTSNGATFVFYPALPVGNSVTGFVPYPNVYYNLTVSFTFWFVFNVKGVSRSGSVNVTPYLKPSFIDGALGNAYMFSARHGHYFTPDDFMGFTLYGVVPTIVSATSFDDNHSTSFSTGYLSLAGNGTFSLKLFDASFSHNFSVSNSSSVSVPTYQTALTKDSSFVTARQFYDYSVSPPGSSSQDLGGSSPFSVLTVRSSHPLPYANLKVTFSIKVYYAFYFDNSHRLYNIDSNVSDIDSQLGTTNDLLNDILNALGGASGDDEKEIDDYINSKFNEIETGVKTNWDILFYPITYMKRIIQAVGGSSTYKLETNFITGYSYNDDTGGLEPVYDFSQMRYSYEDIANGTTTSITFPSFTLPVFDVKLWDSFTFDLSSIKDYFPSLFNAMYVVFGIIEFDIFVHFLYNKYLDVFGKDGE